MFGFLKNFVRASRYAYELPSSPIYYPFLPSFPRFPETLSSVIVTSFLQHSPVLEFIVHLFLCSRFSLGHLTLTQVVTCLSSWIAHKSTPLTEPKIATDGLLKYALLVTPTMAFPL